MLKSILGKSLPEPKTLDEAQQIIQELRRLVIELAQRVEALEEAQELHSGNSSQPPSQDPPKRRAERKKKPPTGRAKGAQPGHPKHERAVLPEAQVDRIERFYGEGRCACGGVIRPDLEPCCRHQVFDLPEVRYTVTEYQVYEGTCVACQARQAAKLPDWVPSGQMGAGLISWIALLSGQYHLSTRQIQSFLEQQWQLVFSLGAISQAQRPVSHWLQPVYAQIGEAVRQAEVAHADETTHYRGSERRWLWTLCTDSAVYFLTHYSRGKGAAAELLQDFDGILISDRHGGYNDYPSDQRQLCWAHLIRNLERIAERRGYAGVLGRQLTRWARLVIRLEHRWRQSGYTSARDRQRLERVRQRFRRLLNDGVDLLPSTRTGNQCQRLLTDEPLFWTFLNHPGIPLTNNTAERALRPYVIWRKISFASQSYRGDQFRPLILSVTETCKRLGLRTYDIFVPPASKACEAKTSPSAYPFLSTARNSPPKGVNGNRATRISP